MDGIYYNVLSREELTCKVTNGNYSGDVVVPSTVTYSGKTFKVLEIGAYAFYHCYDLITVTLPNTITKIGRNAFYDCKNLSSVTFPSSVISIEADAFLGCYIISSVHISDISAWCKIEFEDFESNPLYYAHNLYLNGELLTNLVIPANITEIKKLAFGMNFVVDGINYVTDGLNYVGDGLQLWQHSHPLIPTIHPISEVCSLYIYK